MFFCCICFMKITPVLFLAVAAVSLRSAWLMSRACNPMCASPISPSISAFGDQRRDGVDHDQIDRAGGDQLVGDLQRLLAVVGLRHQQLLGADAQLAGVADVQRVLGVDEGADATGALGLGDRLQRQRGLPR